MANANTIAEVWGVFGDHGIVAAAIIGSVGPGLSTKSSNKSGVNTGFHKAVAKLNGIGKYNVRTLQKWAKSRGYVRGPSKDGPDVWGVYKSDGSFSWRLKLKPESSTRLGLGSGSQQPRFDARLDDTGTYVNPFTGQTGGKSFGTHQSLETRY